jgi:AMMECR1 domain-containing protein
MIKINNLLFVKAKLSYLHKLCTQSLSNRINNETPQEITLIERLNQGVFVKVKKANHTLQGCHMLFVIY